MSGEGGAERRRGGEERRRDGDSEEDDIGEGISHIKHDWSTTP